MKRFKWILLFALFVLLVPIQSANASEFNFSVTTVIPDNQLDPDKTYFDLLLEPGDTQTVEMLLQNDTDSDVVIAPTIHSATTNLNGVVEYGPNDIQADETLQFPLEEWVSTAEEIVVPAGGEFMLPLQIEMPDQAFDGVIAGGITLQEQQDSKDTATNEGDQGLSIENEYAYVVGIVLQQNENAIQPTLNMLDVFPDQLNARNVIQATLQNPEAMYINQLAVDAVVKNESGEVVFEAAQDMMQMAPNSQFNFPISLNGQPLEPGDYRLELAATAMGEEWNWDEAFSIEADEASALNESDVSIPPSDNTWAYIGIGIAFITLSVVLFMIYRRKKKQTFSQPNSNPTASAS